LAAVVDLAAVVAVVAASRAGSAMKAWTKGDRVVQATYGLGTLVEINEHHTVIEFDEHGRRTFSTRLVVLQASSEPAPSRSPRKRATKSKTKDAKTKTQGS
jgi:preprotein translocase subunit YajC